MSNLYLTTSTTNYLPLTQPPAAFFLLFSLGWSSTEAAAKRKLCYFLPNYLPQTQPPTVSSFCFSSSVFSSGWSKAACSKVQHSTDHFLPLLVKVSFFFFCFSSSVFSGVEQGSLQQGATFARPLPATISTSTSYTMSSLCFRPVSLRRCNFVAFKHHPLSLSPLPTLFRPLLLSPLTPTLFLPLPLRESW